MWDRVKIKTTVRLIDVFLELHDTGSGSIRAGTADYFNNNNNFPRLLLKISDRKRSERENPNLAVCFHD